MSDVMLAIKPRWAQLIYSKKKTIEVRRVLPKHLEPGDTIFLYESAPVSMVTGTVAVKSAHYAKDKWTFWNMDGSRACLNEHEFSDYTYGHWNVGVIHLDFPAKWDEPRNYLSFGIKKAPQNFCYIKETQ